MLKYILGFGLSFGVLFANAQDDNNQRTQNQSQNQMNQEETTQQQDQRAFDTEAEARNQQQNNQNPDFNPRGGEEETHGEQLGIYEDQETPKEEPLPEYEGNYEGYDEREGQKDELDEAYYFGDEGEEKNTDPNPVIERDQRGEYEDLEEKTNDEDGSIN